MIGRGSRIESASERMVMWMAMLPLSKCHVDPGIDVEPRWVWLTGMVGLETGSKVQYEDVILDAGLRRNACSGEGVYAVMISLGSQHRYD